MFSEKGGAYSQEETCLNFSQTEETSKAFSVYNFPSVKPPPLKLYVPKFLAVWTHSGCPQIFIYFFNKEAWNKQKANTMKESLQFLFSLCPQIPIGTQIQDEKVGALP